ncbi:adenosylcobinamide-GDP ribazoletransferase [Actinomycetospora lemnae]|uniref:Adenosylcobinamide-GDP ribazoletransferase n=1 Tax=Actinomycetospora lemnae TaxID=3019891 RepID=A0ABT5SZ95_9PSEU|nr:adenosylcobinamide-GDP ribazoletransferase [Actinomycetospora sp. DW7H6]MDD7968185.1 adenosylcobinamide-GDP ribazoletransferase [Actinomycetospora sp. DW7H6]
MRAGLALAIAMFTVVPVRASRIDRPAARVALAVVPLVGVVLGAMLGAVAAGLVAAGAPGLLGGLVAVGLGAAATRGLHLDGLADLADGLGSHGDAARTLAIMKDPGVGAFAVVWLVVVLGVQAAAFGALAERGLLVAVVGGALALGLGRAAFAWVARRGVPAASPDGLGALVAGTQPAWVAPVWAVVLGASAFPVLGRRVAVAAVLAAVVVVLVAAHARRRLGGVSGDVFGACAELAVTAGLVVLATA